MAIVKCSPERPETISTGFMVANSSPPLLLDRNTTVLQLEWTIMSLGAVNHEDSFVQCSQKMLRQKNHSMQLSRRFDLQSQQILFIEPPLDLNSSVESRHPSSS